MSDDRRPWWASATDGAPAPSDDGEVSTDDPVTAHRAARRRATTPNGAGAADEDPFDGTGDPGGPGAQGAQGAHGGSGAHGGPAGGDERPPRPAGAAPSHADAICGVCPICVLARTLGDTHPELLGHVTEAARHLAAAARAMLDPSGPPDHGPEGVQRIDLD
jgi:hypothetical protein